MYNWKLILFRELLNDASEEKLTIAGKTVAKFYNTFTKKVFFVYWYVYWVSSLQPKYTVSQKNVLTLKRYSSKLQGVILMKFGRNIQNTLE